MTETILIIDDEQDIRDLLADIFIDEGYAVLKAAHSEQALSLIKTNKVDLIVLDIWLDNSDMDGMQILKHLKTRDHFKTIPVLMISGHGNVEIAVNAMKVGAFDFIEKPFKIDHILLTVQRALEQKSLRDENSRLKETTDLVSLKHQYKSPSMIALIKAIGEHSESDARVMIIGAHGTGKTRFARVIHDISKRANHALKFIDCQKFVLQGLDDEITHNPNGSIVLENVERLDNNSQSDLLNYLTRIQPGSRIISTAADDIAKRVQDKSFSSALYDRLAVLKYTLPALNNRLEDMDILISEFLETYRQDMGFDVRNDFLPSSQLRNMNWNGNIKQLKSAVEWMVFCQNGNVDTPTSYQLPFQKGAAEENIEYLDIKREDNTCLQEMFSSTLKEARDMFEYKYLGFVLEKFDGNIAKVAAYIDMDRTALHRKLKSMNLTFETKIKAEHS